MLCSEYETKVNHRKYLPVVIVCKGINPIGIFIAVPSLKLMYEAPSDRSSLGCSLTLACFEVR